MVVAGTPLRQFIYSEDLAKLLVFTLEHYDSIEPLILSVPPESEVAIGAVAQLIADVLDKSRVPQHYIELGIAKTLEKIKIKYESSHFTL